MKQVLIIAYYFPPMGMGGTQRVAKFCKYLPKFGWKPTVLTISTTGMYYAYDHELLADVAEASIVRTRSLDPLFLSGLLAGRKKVRGRPRKGSSASWLTGLLPPDSKVCWLPFAKAAAARLLARQRFDAVLVSSPPHSAHFLGAWLRARAGLPYVADFRDSWWRGPVQQELTPVHEAFDRWAERKIARYSDFVVCVTSGLERYFRQKLGKKNTGCIYNGYDPEDFAPYYTSPLPRRKAGNEINIGFVGSMTRFTAERDLLHVLACLEMGLRNRIRLRVAGADLTGNFEEEVYRLGLQDRVEILGYLPHSEAVRVLCESDLLYLPVAAGFPATCVPGKVFEYLASTRPILASVPPGETEDILRSAGLAWLSRPGDLDALTENLIHLVSALADGEDLKRPHSAFSRFSRLEQTKALAGILDELTRH